MSDKIKDAMFRAAQAQELKENGLFQEVFAALKSTTVDRWTASRPGEVVEQTNLHAFIHALNEIERFFNDAIVSGRLAAESLEYQEAERKRQLKLRTPN